MVDHRVRAYEAEGEERDRLWHERLEVYPGFAGYQQRITGRHILVVVLASMMNCTFPTPESTSM